MWIMKDAVDPEGPPLQAPDAVADTIPGFSCLIGILAALISRTKTGKGQRVDVAQMDSMIATMQSFSFWNIANTTFMQAGRSGNVGVGELKKAKDGYVMLSLTPGRITDWFKELLGVDELNESMINEWIAGKTTEEIVNQLVEVGVPVGKVMDLDEAQNTPQAKARNMFVKVDHPVLGEIVEPGFPIKFSNTKGDLSTPAPLLGEHNMEVFTQLLGLNSERYNELRKKGVI